PLLAIYDEQTRHFLFWSSTNRSVGIRTTIFPEEKITNGKAAIHRVKQITYLGHRPNKGTLNVRQPDFSHRYIFNQFLKDIINLLEKYFLPYLSLHACKHFCLEHTFQRLSTGDERIAVNIDNVRTLGKFVLGHKVTVAFVIFLCPACGFAPDDHGALAFARRAAINQVVTAVIVQHLPLCHVQPDEIVEGLGKVHFLDTSLPIAVNMQTVVEGLAEFFRIQQRFAFARLPLEHVLE